jgi:hypothetical protein
MKLLHNVFASDLSMTISVLFYRIGQNRNTALLKIL